MDFAQIDIAALDNRIRELQLKRWWIAEQIGVDRKTITRWLTGHTRRIHRDNLDRLAAILECMPDDLVAPSDDVASPSDQHHAAQLIEQENLLEILTPGGKWPLLEELIKATMRPDLPKPLLGQLYNYLSIAAWRRSQLDKAESYCMRAKTIGEETGFKAVQARARLNEATILSFRGQVEASLAAYKDCVEQKEYAEDEMVYASALSNLGSVYHEYGDLQASLMYQDRAIAAFEDLDKPVNLSIAWIARAAVLVEAKEWNLAEEAVAKSFHYVELGKWERGVGDAGLVKAALCAGRQDAAGCRAAIDAALAQFQKLGIDEARNHVTLAMAWRLEQQFDEASRSLTHAMTVNPDFPIAQTEVLREWLRLAETVGDEKLREEKRNELASLYERCGCLAWLERLA